MWPFGIKTTRQKSRRSTNLRSRLEARHQFACIETLEDRLLLAGAAEWSTYIGGIGTEISAGGVSLSCHVALNDEGDVYITGATRSPDWGPSLGDGLSYHGDWDAFVVKLDTNGNWEWTKLLGGSGDDRSRGIAVDPITGDVLISGWTSSSNWDVEGAVPPVTLHGDYDVFVTRLSQDGVQRWTKLLGGTGDDRGGEVALTKAGGIVVTGESSSPGMESGQHSRAHSGGADGFVTRLTPAGRVDWFTYLGGTDRDILNGVAVDDDGNIAVAGVAFSSETEGFPILNAFDPSFNGGAHDAVVARLSPSGELQWASFFGTPGDDTSYGAVATDLQGNVYFLGNAQIGASPDVPFSNVPHGNTDIALLKIQPDGALANSGLYIGSAGDELGTGMAVDEAGNVILTGLTTSTDFLDGFSTDGAIDLSLGGSHDAFVVKITAELQPDWGTFMGGERADYGLDLAMNSAGDVVAVGYTASPDFPVLNAVDGALGGSSDAFATKFSGLASHVNHPPLAMEDHFVVGEDSVRLIDDFDDGNINTTLWAVGGREISWSPDSHGNWSWSQQEVVASDGYLSLRTHGPQSGNTYGAVVWVHSTYNFNDGAAHIINFTWMADVSDNHNNLYHIQISDGYIPPFDVYSNEFNYLDEYLKDPISAPYRAGTMDFLWDETGLHPHRGRNYVADSPKMTWSMEIDPSGIGRLFDAPDGGGTLIREETLNADTAWYLRFLVDDATSAGFPAGDSRLNLYDVSDTMGNVLTNDTDLDGDQLVVTAVAGVDSYVGNEITLPSGALLRVNTDGSVEYNPNGQFESLASGESTIDGFTYTVSDGNGGTDTTTVTVTIVGENDAPIANPDSFATRENAIHVADDFEDGNIDTRLWATGGREISWSPDHHGNWSWSQQEISTPEDGYLRLRTTGPQSANTYGAVAWVHSTYNFNDGVSHVINFTWMADVSDNHNNLYHIQISDGYIPPFDVYSNEFNHLREYLDDPISAPYRAGTIDFLWDETSPHPHRGRNYAVDSPKMAWSLEIDPSGVGRLFDGPDGRGSIIHEEALNSTTAWYLRFLVDDATSAGFPAGDSRLNLYDVSDTMGSVLGNDIDPESDELTITAVEEAGSNVGNEITLSSGALLRVDRNGNVDYNPNGQFANLGSGEWATDQFTYTVDDGNGGIATTTATVTIVGPLLGDMNTDASVNGLDVAPFMDTLLNGPVHDAGDMNRDGFVNGLDVDLFVAAIVSGANTTRDTAPSFSENGLLTDVGQPGVMSREIHVSPTAARMANLGLQLDRHDRDWHKDDQSWRLLKQRATESLLGRRLQLGGQAHRMSANDVALRMRQHHRVVGDWQSAVELTFQDGADWIG